MPDSTTPSHVFIDAKRGTVSILLNGTWWRLPLDSAVGEELIKEYQSAVNNQLHD